MVEGNTDSTGLPDTVKVTGTVDAVFPAPGALSVMVAL